MSYSILSIKSEESKCLKQGNYKLYFKDDSLCLTDGVRTISINLNTFEIYDPTTSTALLPYYYAGVMTYSNQTVKACLESIITKIISQDTEIDLKSDIGHVHDISDVTNLQTALNAKADIGHIHVIGDVNGLGPMLMNKSDIDHTHSSFTDLELTTLTMNNKRVIDILGHAASALDDEQSGEEDAEHTETAPHVQNDPL